MKIEAYLSDSLYKLLFSLLDKRIAKQLSRFSNYLDKLLFALLGKRIAKQFSRYAAIFMA